MVAIWFFVTVLSAWPLILIKTVSPSKTPHSTKLHPASPPKGLNTTCYCDPEVFAINEFRDVLFSSKYEEQCRETKKCIIPADKAKIDERCVIMKVINFTNSTLPEPNATTYRACAMSYHQFISVEELNIAWGIHSTLVLYKKCIDVDYCNDEAVFGTLMNKQLHTAITQCMPRTDEMRQQVVGITPDRHHQLSCDCNGKGPMDRMCEDGECKSDESYAKHASGNTWCQSRLTATTCVAYSDGRKPEAHAMVLASAIINGDVDASLEYCHHRNHCNVGFPEKVYNASQVLCHWLQCPAPWGFETKRTARWWYVPLACVAAEILSGLIVLVIFRKFDISILLA